jgi:hypothetical protein
MKTYDGTNIAEVFTHNIGSSNDWMRSLLGNGWEDYSYEVFYYGKIRAGDFKNATFVFNNASLTNFVWGSGVMAPAKSLVL